MPSRWNGLLVLGLAVLIGLGSGAAYYHYKQPKMAAELKAQLAAAPSTLEGRVAQWHRFGATMIHHRLTQVARISDEQPWLVTHVVRADDGPPEVWGIDLTELPRELSHREGPLVVVELPAPRLLAREPLVGDAARHVPSFGPGEPVPDPKDKLRELVLWFLEGLPAALEKDIPGSRLEVRVADNHEDAVPRR